VAVDISPHYQRLQRALDGERLPVAVVDLDAFDANLDALAGIARAAGKPLRLATKSVRCPALIERALAHGSGAVRSLLTFSAAETALLAAQGQRDLLLAYPTLHAADLRALARANRGGARAAAVADCDEHVAALAAAAGAEGATLPVAIDVDVSYRPAGSRLHLGVRRSPLREPAEVVALARRIAGQPSLRFWGLLAYEAQIAGLSDAGAHRRLLKRLSRPAVLEQRARVVAALREAGLPPPDVNGGGTGSARFSGGDPSLTEVAAGSGLLCSHLFDGYDGLSLRPALWFALEVTRRPAPRVATCQGGGIVASGEAGTDRLPQPALPEGLRLLPLEGAGEVQTPLALPDGLSLPLGAPVFFRPAKAGEAVEHFAELLLVRGDRVTSRAPTYRGLGHAFLG
jgi:D-serine deaminase-like pyridoxal phosphate-dependent protein